MDNATFTADSHEFSASAADLLDQDIFHSLVETFAGDADGGLREVFALFFEHMPQRFDALTKALQEHDGEGLASIAHSMKGSCANFGAVAMATACSRLEGVLKRDPTNMAEATQLTNTLSALYQLTERHIRNLIE